MADAKKIMNILKKQYPQSRCALEFQTPAQLLVSTILSAQCTDKRVNIVTKELFRKYKTANDFANVTQKKLEKEIRSTGFYHNKAKNIISACKMIEHDYNGTVPKKMEELIKLPGVARKTGNIVLSVAYGINEGIAVDTHVTRLSQRLGLTKNANPVKIEKDLMPQIPKSEWDIFSLMLIQHGREICYARKPACSECILKKLCPSAFRV